MTLPEVHFDSDFPGAFQPLIGSLITEHLYLCPLWLQYISVCYDTNQGEASCTWYLDRDYRRARLAVYPSFFNEAPRMQREMIVHEIFHCYTIPLKTVCLDAFDDLDVDPGIRNVLSRRIVEVMEQVTQDFAYSIARK